MVKYKTMILKFGDQGEKTGWTYIEVPADVAQKLKKDKKSFRVKGKLDNYSIKGVALLPMGDGNFIMPLKAQLRKGIGKRDGAMLMVELEVDNAAFVFDKDFMACLKDEPAAIIYFKKLPKSHQHYFSKWIESAKTEATKAKRIAMAINALAKEMGFMQMLRASKGKN